MASLKTPKLLLLDEHTAALDPKTAAKVLELTDKTVNEDKLTTLMITHKISGADSVRQQADNAVGRQANSRYKGRGKKASDSGKCAR